MLLLEAVGMTVLTVILLLDLFAGQATDGGAAVVLIVITALAAAAGFAIAGATWRGQSWIRGAVLTWQILQLAVAAGSFQGVGSRPDVGWLLLVPALAALLLLFTPAVVTATRRS